MSDHHKFGVCTRCGWSHPGSSCAGAAGKRISRKAAFQFVSYAVDNALSPREPEEAPENARLVGWQAGYEPLFVAVWSYLGDRLDDSEATELATDLLAERGWFTDNDTPPPPDYIL